MKLPKNLKETVAKNTRADITHLMGLLEFELDKHPENPNWAQVGDLKHLRRNLLEAVAVFSDMSINDIEQTLEDARR